MKLTLFIAGVAFAAPNQVKTCMKHMLSNEGQVMERAMGTVVCLERSDTNFQPGQCLVQFTKVISFDSASSVRFEFEDKKNNQSDFNLTKH